MEYSREYLYRLQISIIIYTQYTYNLMRLRILQNPCSLRLNLIIIILFSKLVLAIYDVPSIYGHFSRIFFNLDQIRSGTFKYFQYHYAVDMDSSNTTIYYANSQLHCIQKFDLITKSKTILAGICGKSGNRVGGVDVMLLNNPSSVVSYQPNQQSEKSEIQMKMLIVANKSCLLTEPGCVLSDQSALSLNLTMNNLLPYPPILQFPALNTNSKRYLYISDTDNHCIKMIDMSLESSTVVTGQCGTQGFMDGPFGYNRLNRPTSLGITRTGILYFYDEGNEYMRKLSPNGQVVTLKNGACKQFGISRKIGGYSFKNILCYDNWVELSTKAPVQHVINTAQINICIEHSSNC